MTVRTRTQGGWTTALIFGASVCLSGVVRAEPEPFKFSLAPEDESVYAPPTPPREEQGINQGGVNLDLSFSYMSDYVYRGVDHSNFEGRSKKPNIQFAGTVDFNTGKLPHPFVGIFANLYDNDPVSRFQEIRPYAGFDWNLRPITLDVGMNSYIYPEREDFNTSEAWVKLTFDDSTLFRTERPVLTPYVYAAYDYDKNNGFYVEAGVSHDFVIEDLGLTFTVLADAAYVSHIREVFIFTNENSSGFQHYDVGLISAYQLNGPLHISRRFGEIDLKGYLYYTDGISNKLLHADTKVWGGVGVQFKY